MIKRFVKWWAKRHGWVIVDTEHLEDMKYRLRALQRQCCILDLMGTEKVTRI
jgi:hypothetical protein